MTEVKNLYLRFKKRYDGISENGSRPYITFDTINEHIKESPLIWGQFTKNKSDNLISKARIHELNKNKGYVFFISNDVYGGTRLFYGKIINIYSNDSGGEKIPQSDKKLIPKYYQELYSEHINDDEQKYKFKVGLWIKISFFKEIDLSILDEIISTSRLKSKIGETFEPTISEMRRRRAFGLSFFEFSSEEIDPRDYEETGLMRRLTLIEGSIIPPLRKKTSSIGVKDVNDEGEIYYNLFNPKILEVDAIFFENRESSNFNDEINPEKYSPYIYEFYPTHGLDKINAEEIFSNISIYSQIDVDLGIKGVEKEDLISGKIKYCASPQLSLPAFLKIDSSLNENEKKELSELLEKGEKQVNVLIENQKVLLENNNEVEEELNNKINSLGVPKNINVNVYNTGQANCIRITIINNKSEEYNIMFDVGYQNKTQEDLVTEVSKSINYSILSHWDTDHICGALQVLTNDRNIDWLAPQNSEKHKTMSYYRLAIYLMQLGKLKLVSNSLNNNQVFSNNFFRLYKGDGVGLDTVGIPKCSKRYYRENNNVGLIIELFCNDKKMLLPGDCEYSSIPISFSDVIYNYLIVSHHGAQTTTVPVNGNTIDNEFRSIGTPQTKNTYSKSLAITCCNSGGKYPFSTHETDLESKNFQILKTGDFDKGIRVEL